VQNQERRGRNSPELPATPAVTAAAATTMAEACSTAATAVAAATIVDPHHHNYNGAASSAGGVQYKDQVLERTAAPRRVSAVMTTSSSPQPPTAALSPSPSSPSVLNVVHATPVIDNDPLPISIGSEERQLRLQQRNLELQLQLRERELELERQRQQVVPGLFQQPRQQRRKPSTSIPQSDATGTSSAPPGAVVFLPKKYLMGMGVVVTALLLAVALVAGICATGNCGGGADAAASPPAGKFVSPRALEIYTYINDISLLPMGRIVRYPDGSTPEGRALAWLIDMDVGTNTSNELGLRQRYALATLWFQRTPPSMGDGLDQENFAATWGSSMNECEWKNVWTCDNGHVSRLSLDNERVRGRIPDELGLLTGLTELHLGRNMLTGTIPSSLA
jgi:hypothetical protein